MPRTGTLIAVVILAILAFVAWEWRNSPLFSQLLGSASPGTELAAANYTCDGGKTIAATYYQGAEPPAPAPGEPPAPTGSARVVLSDGREMTLAQTISADGVRYANKDESFVFWSKGNGALVLENNQQQSYTGCIEVAQDPGALPNIFESGSEGFSLRYPSGWSVDSTYAYQELGPGHDIGGVKFTIDPTLTLGTNLSRDSYLSVEEIASSTNCSADQFLDAPGQVSRLDDGSVSYSYATSSGAGAGNLYEEQVFAIPGTNPCIAVRYFIHSGNIGNYPPGAVREFDRNALAAQFDAIRRTLTVQQ